MTRGGRAATIVLGTAFVVLGLLSGWSTGRFVQGATRKEGRVFASAGATLLVECAAGAGRREILTVRRPMLGFYRAGAPLAILVNPAVASDPLHPEFYSVIPVIARVDSALQLWAPGILLLAVGGSLVTLTLLAARRPHGFRVSTRFELSPRRRPEL
jgi:hypothetical protein